MEIFIIFIAIFSLFAMVRVKKQLTHIYHEKIDGGIVNIGENKSFEEVTTELFAKQLVLTSDLKRLPYLLGGKLSLWVDAHIGTSLIASGLRGVGINAVLMNGFYDGASFQTYPALMLDDKAQSDILMTAFGVVDALASEVASFSLPSSHWDFEGDKILYDTITLIVFLDCDTNVATSVFGASNTKAMYELEIDWKPIDKPELMEFLMEHIYARQGD